MTGRLLVTIEEAAEALACSPRLCQTLIYQGRLESVKLNRRRLVPVTSLHQLVERLREEAADSAGRPALEVLATAK